MLEVIRQDYVRTAPSKALAERTVITQRARRNALIPLVTIVALSISGLFAGAPITETVFAWPGVGRLLVDSVIGGDYIAAQAVLMFLAVLVLVFNLVADIGYGLPAPHTPPSRVGPPRLPQPLSPPFRPGPLLGTADLGHDVLTRLLYAGRVSMLVGFAAALSAVALGTIVGVVAGFDGGIAGNLLMR